MRQFIISQELAQKLFDYLVAQPFRANAPADEFKRVQELINALHAMPLAKVVGETEAHE